MTFYYRWFNKDYAALSGPITSLLNKYVVWIWCDREERAFELLKGALVTCPILSHLKEVAELLLNTGASYESLWAVLSQRAGGKETVVYYLSRRLTDSRWY